MSLSLDQMVVLSERGAGQETLQADGGLHPALQVLGDTPDGQHQGEHVLLLQGIPLY